MSLSLEQTRQILKSIPLTSLPTNTSNSRLFALHRCVLTPSFFTNFQERHTVKTPFFSMYTSKISHDILNSINQGPSWLKGPYPPGILPKKHEKYRLINYMPTKMILATSRDESSQIQSDQVNDRIAQTRLPILQAEDPSNNLIPVVFIATKKRTHKDAAKRNLARRKVKTAMEYTVKEFEGTSKELIRDPLTALVVQADRSVIEASSHDLRKEMRTALSRLHSLRSQAFNQKFRKQTTSIPQKSHRKHQKGY